jgi:hypothetical protein
MRRRSSRSVPAGAAFGLRGGCSAQLPAGARQCEDAARDGLPGTRPASPAFSSGGSFAPTGRPVRKAAGRSQMGQEPPLALQKTSIMVPRVTGCDPLSVGFFPVRHKNGCGTSTRRAAARARACFTGRPKGACASGAKAIFPGRRRSQLNAKPNMSDVIRSSPPR